MTPTTSIIIPVHNQLRYTKECWESLVAHTHERRDVLFIDNASTDGTGVWLQDRLASIHNHENRGYAAACNQGIIASRGEYICLLNNDVVVTPGWLSGLLAALQLPGVGIVGPTTNCASGPQGSEHFRKKNRGKVVEVARLIGFCMVFRRSLVDRIGLLDERFWPGNFEDDDYCRRSIAAGFRNVVACDVFVHHYGGRSFEGMDYEKIVSTNRKLYEEKWSFK
jgi:O-antigen biosynthesis protein